VVSPIVEGGWGRAVGGAGRGDRRAGPEGAVDRWGRKGWAAVDGWVAAPNQRQREEDT
jgi:hypothetical protein